MTSFTLLPALAGCSSFSSPSSSASTNSPNPYQTAAAPGPSAPPPAAPQSYSAVPAPTLASAPVAASSAPPPNELGTSDYPYPKRSIVELFQGSTESSPPAQYVPHPPSTYTPTAAPQSYSAVSAPTVAAAPVAAASAPPPNEPGTSNYPYPKQSLVELFKGSTESSPPTQYVPHPPSTYTPTAAPYSASQPVYGAPAASAASGTAPGAAAPPTNPEPTASVYPQESLFDLFSK